MTQDQIIELILTGKQMKSKAFWVADELVNAIRQIGVVAMNWIPITLELPPDGIEVETKIDDERGVRNKTTLKRQGRLWFFPDMSMYVYYTPTHWRRRQEQEQTNP